MQENLEGEGILRQALLEEDKVKLLREDPMMPQTEDKKESQSSSLLFEPPLPSPAPVEPTEFTVHLLSQLSTAFLPTITPSQVSSVLSALEQTEDKFTPGSALAEFLKIQKDDKIKKKLIQTEKFDSYVEVRIGDQIWHRCPSCPFLSATKESASSHFSHRHCKSQDRLEKDVICISCTNSFGTTQGIKEHLLTDHSCPLTEVERLVETTIEVNKTWSKKRTEDDIRPESSDKTKCDQEGCTVRLMSKEHLEYHKKCHIAGVNGSYKCPECYEKHSNWRSIRNHVWKKHGVDLGLFSCAECSFKTPSRSILVNLHRRIHSEERPFECETCQKSFKNKKQLRNHKIIHKTKWNRCSLSCMQCSRTFSDAKMLRNHTDTVHKGIRPYLCTICGHAAASRSSLTMHTRSHTGEKPYSCPDCDYTTADHNSLRRHKMRHTGDKHYKCPYCPYASIQSSTYKHHLKNKHPDMANGIMFSCNLCPFKTVKREIFLTHSSYHDESKEPEVNLNFTSLI